MSQDTIAIIGLAARVPGAADVHELWDNLVNGRESISVFDRDNQLTKGVPIEQVDDPAFVSAAPVLDGMADFDAHFFGMTPRDAEITDPQHRLFLELSNTALEDAGYDPRRYPGSIGVFGGCGPDTYRWRNVERSASVLGATNWLAVTVGNYPDYFATRVSYRLNLRGPSYGLQTACSTSLVALHVAVEALLRDECDMALAGGVCIELPHGVGYLYDGGVTSTDGHCRPFDAQASGTVWSSGGGVVLLKRTSRAIEDGDTIRGIVLGSAINNDGAAKSGITAPSAAGQTFAARQALAKAGVDRRSVSYVEAHGTGTQLGDPVELAGLVRAYQDDPADTGWCLLGSVKSNIGHLSQAAGVVGVIKTVLSLEHGEIPPTVNFVAPNPVLEIERTPFRVAATRQLWPGGDDPRRAGVSSFGIGGTNAHVVLEEAPPATRTEPRDGVRLLQVSARSTAALDQLVDRISGFVNENPDTNLDDVAYTLRVGRGVHKHRAVAVAGGETLTGDAWQRDSAEKDPPGVAFLFSGQGAQCPGMAGELYEREPVFRTVLDDCLSVVEPDLRETLRNLLLSPAPGIERESPIHQTRFTQPALFVLEYALARLLLSWGVRPAGMIGHSIGEYVAATVAGVFAAHDGMRLIVRRAELMQSTEPGGMLSVQQDLAELVLPDGVSVACVNGPGSVVVSGPTAAVRAYAEELIARGVDCRLLRTSHAFHSALMDPIVAEFRAEVVKVTRHSPSMPYLSNVTGTWQTAEQAQDPDYWAAHLRQPVQFTANVAALVRDGQWATVECGPGRQLTALVLAHGGVRAAVACLPKPVGTSGSASGSVRLAAGRLWTVGVPLDEVGFGERGRRVPLPTYPYQRSRHWATPDPAPHQAPERAAAVREDEPAPRPVEEWFHVESWARDPQQGAPGELAHCVLFATDDVLAAELRARGVEVVRVRPGERYCRTAGGDFLVDPEDPEHYAHLVQDLGCPTITRIVHAWSVNETSTEEALTRGFYSLMRLVQAIAAAGPIDSVHLDILTAGAQDVVGVDLINPAQATVSGIAKVLPLESPTWSVRHIDHAQDTDLPTVVDEILRAPEMTAAVAIRNGHRWRPNYRQVRLETSAVEFPERGAYLITGGLGGIGLTIAEDLAARSRARLVLTGRLGLPARKTWQRYLAARGSSDSTGRAIEAVLRMEAHGADVRVVAADVTVPEDMAEVRDLVRSEFGRLNGIIHAAGVPTGTMLEIQDREASAQVLAPKLTGTELLLEEFAGSDAPNFVLLCSSITAAFGRLGHADYCAANAFLDAVARSRAGQAGPRVLSVGWDAWLNIGMAVDRSEPDHVREARRIARGRVSTEDVGIAPEDGVEAFHRLVHSGLAGAVLTSVLPVDAARAGWQVDVGMLNGAVTGQEHTPEPASHEPAGNDGGDLERTLTHIWADTLGHPNIGPEQDFVELGGDSLTAIRLLSRIREETGVALTRKALFAASTVRGLATVVEELRAGGTTGELATAGLAPIARLARD